MDMQQQQQQQQKQQQQQQQQHPQQHQQQQYHQQQYHQQQQQQQQQQQLQQPAAMGIPMGQSNAPMYHPGSAVGDFSIGLFDCFADIDLCCLTTWCPCITFGRIAEIVDRGYSSCGTSGALYSLLLVFTGLQSIYSCTYRSKLKAQLGLPDDAVATCCTSFWCEPCTLCQEYRELQRLGYNLALGWHGNMEMRQNQGTVMPPMVPSGMIR